MLVRYRAPKDAVTWLRKVFGFEVRSIARTLDDAFAYAHLAFEGSPVKVMATAEGTRDAAASDRSYTLAVSDVEAHYKRTKAAGAQIVAELPLGECSGRSYVCRDLEGNTWRFAARDLETRKNLPVVVAQGQTRSASAGRRNGIALALAFAIIAGGAVFWQLRTPRVPSPDPDTVALATTKETLRRTQALLEEQRAAREKAEASERRTQVERAGLQARLDEARATIVRLETEISEARANANRAAAEAQEAINVEEVWETTHVRADAVAASIPPPARLNHPLLDDGYDALVRGDIEAARRRFRSLAEQGLPEAALALGSTYDPVNARGGDANTADRERAKHWYRRAIELAQAATERPQP
jgi:uncharacterized glyoxalase superfamily protein PhnB